MVSLQLNFVNELPEMINIECPICFRIMSTEPNLTLCCGRHFCGACVKKVKERKAPTCPLCKATAFNTIVDKDRLRIIQGLEVYCTNKDEGCNWKGTLKKLPRHTNRGEREGECLMEIVKCQNGQQNSYRNKWLRSLYDSHAHLSGGGGGEGGDENMCHVEGTRKDIKIHEKEECPYRPYSCQHCEYSGTYNEVIEFHSKSCPFQPMSCPNECPSQEKFNRKSLKSHLKVCPLQAVECEFQWAGCSEKPLRKDLPQHSNEKLKDHLTLVLDACTKLTEDNQVLRKENGILESENERLQLNNEQLMKECAEMRLLVKKKSSSKI